MIGLHELVCGVPLLDTLVLIREVVVDLRLQCVPIVEVEQLDMTTILLLDSVDSRMDDESSAPNGLGKPVAPVPRMIEPRAERISDADLDAGVEPVQVVVPD